MIVELGIPGGTGALMIAIPGAGGPIRALIGHRPTKKKKTKPKKKKK